MKETLLLVGHGSRDTDGNDEVMDFAQYWKQQALPEGMRLEVCFIEFAETLLEAGLDNAAKNADRVIVLPLVLSAAGHVKMEIPAAIAAARARHPGVEYLYTRPLGNEELILKLLRMRLHSAMSAMDMPDPKSTGVILLGRGSSDMDANGDVAKMGRWIYETTRHEMVEAAFTGVTYPRLESVVQRLVRLGMTQVIVVPYYLFTGRLIKRIERQVERLAGIYPTTSLGLARYMGLNEKLVSLVSERLEETRSGSVPTMACDGCRIREVAQEHMHHHEH